MRLSSLLAIMGLVLMYPSPASAQTIGRESLIGMWVGPTPVDPKNSPWVDTVILRADSTMTTGNGFVHQENLFWHLVADTLWQCRKSDRTDNGDSVYYHRKVGNWDCSDSPDKVLLHKDGQLQLMTYQWCGKNGDPGSPGGCRLGNPPMTRVASSKP